MKKILTLVTPDEADTADTTAPEEVELIGTDSGKNLFESIKKAKGKYTALFSSDAECDLDEGLFKALDGANSDIIVFDGGYCFKTSVIKGVANKYCTGRFRAETYAAFSSKSITKLDFKPFTCTERAPAYSENDENELYGVLEDFSKIKARLNKEIYSFAFELISDRLVKFYVSAIIAVREGTIPAEKLKDFDAKLKENVVLYLTLDKRFTAADLKKLRNKDFKAGFLTYRKLKKL